MFNSRALLPTQEELNEARDINYKETVKKTIIKKCGFTGVDKGLPLEGFLISLNFPLQLTAKKLPYTENILLELYKRPTRTNVWKAYTTARDDFGIASNAPFGLVFNVPKWSSTVVFHDYWVWGQTAFHGFGCWLRIDYNNMPGKFFIETLTNLLERFNKDGLLVD